MDVTAYCLMSNHYHLLVHTPEGNLTRCMRHLGGVYTQLFNRRHGHDGPLFRGRYKAILVEEEEYLLGLVRYVHHNPLKAGVVKTLKEYPWSSHHAYLSRVDGRNWLFTGPVLARFPSDPELARRQYRQYMAQDDSEEIERVFSLKKLPAVLGSKHFLQSIKDTFFGEKFHQEVPESRSLAPSSSEILRVVCEEYGTSEDDLLITRRGETNEARNVAIFLLRTIRGETLPSIATMFGISTYSTVSSVLVRFQSRLKEEEALQNEVKSLKKKLLVSQEQI
jgi:putative transposase